MSQSLSDFYVVFLLGFSQIELDQFHLLLYFISKKKERKKRREMYLLLGLNFIVGHWLSWIWWLLKEPFCEWWNIQDTSLVESCLELHWQQLPLSPHVAHDRDVAPKSFATDNLQISHRCRFLVSEDELQFPRVDLFQFCYCHEVS